MDKLNIEQVCILCTKSIADERIAKFFQSRGAYSQYIGDAIDHYYYVHNGVVTFQKTKPKGKIRINPWKRSYRKFPRLMMVSDDQKFWTKRMVYGKLQDHDYPFIISEQSEYMFEGWRYAKEIKEDLP
jgi:hypothetical protein